MNNPEKKSWRQSTWVTVVCCFLLIFTSLGFCSSPKSFFMDVVPDALGVGRSEFALNDTARYVVNALMSLFFGVFVTKLGLKKMIAIGFALLVGSQVVYATADNVLMFCAGGALLGAGLTFTSNTLASYMVKRYVHKNTGTVLGFVMAANGLGGAFATQLVSYFIEQSPTGYKNAYYAVAAVLATVGVIILLLFKEDKSVPLVAPAQKKARGNNWIGFEYKHGLKRPYFIPVCILIFLTGFVLAGVNGIAKAHWRDVGIQDVATIWSVHSLALMGGKFITGFVYDKKGLRFTLLVGQFAAVTVLLALVFAANTPLGIALAWYYSLFSAVSLPLETIGVSLVAGDIFGNRDFPKFLGIMNALNYAGFALGSPVINLVYDKTGTYIPGILAAVGVMVVVAVVFQFVITKAHKDAAEYTAALETEAAN